jgi:gamma-glutamyltranspeptidase/glutathione hydrolase
MRSYLTILLAAALAACTTTNHTNAPALVEQQAPGVVSAADPRAAEAGATILRQGGSAADAALATLLALTVVEPQSSGIGGGGFLIYQAPGASVTSYNGRETAPMAAGPDWFFKDGKPMATRDAVPGGKSVGVPGNLRLMAMAHKDHGKLAWRQLFEPAIRLAKSGFAITPRLYTMLERARGTAALTPSGRALFFLPDGKPKPVGTIVINAALAQTLEALAARGPDSFYVGPNAQALVETVNNASRNPSRMTVGDMAAYAAQEKPAECGTYRGHRICGMGPPSSGATTVFATLKQLERFDMAALGKDNPVAWHLMAESMRLAFADRELYLADDDFVPVPVKGLMDPTYLASRSALISPEGTMAKVAAGSPPGAPHMAAGRHLVEQGTSHFVAVDRWGGVASLTSTIESVFGSGLVTGGYYLNNELTDFSLEPVGRDGRPVANRVEGGKRPRSSMAPTIVYAPDGQVRLAIGAAGGATIPAQVAKAIVAVIDWGLPVRDAIALPVIYAPGDTVFVEQASNLEAMIPALRALGHADVRPRAPSFKANAIEWRDGRWVGAADPRSEGAAVTP